MPKVGAILIFRLFWPKKVGKCGSPGPRSLTTKTTKTENFHEITLPQSNIEFTNFTKKSHMQKNPG